MNQNISRYLYIFITICVIVVVAKLFISILPWLLIAIAITYCIRKIKKVIDDRRNINSNKSNSEFNNYSTDDIYENSQSQYTNGEVIDVEYEDVDNKK